MKPNTVLIKKLNNKFELEEKNSNGICPGCSSFLSGIEKTDEKFKDVFMNFVLCFPIGHFEI